LSTVWRTKYINISESFIRWEIVKPVLTFVATVPRVKKILPLSAASTQNPIVAQAEGSALTTVVAAPAKRLHYSMHQNHNEL
jgi:hypothetical protein